VAEFQRSAHSGKIGGDVGRSRSDRAAQERGEGAFEFGAEQGARREPRQRERGGTKTEQVRAHCRGEGGRPGAAVRREALEHPAFNHHLFAAELEEVILLAAKLLEPFFQRCLRALRRQQRVEPFERPVGRLERAGEALGLAFGGEREPGGAGEVSAAKVYDNLIYSLSINGLG
jgi:hypothetical protein